MPKFTLAAPEEKIVVSWLFEPNGYLNDAVRVSDSMTARQALAADPTLDVTQWIRDYEMIRPARWPDLPDQVAMTWWVWKNSGVNVPPPQKPPETASWIAILEYWDSTIDAGFANIPLDERDPGNTVNIHDEDGQFLETMPHGAQLAHQQSLIRKVLGVLQ